MTDIMEQASKESYRRFRDEAMLVAHGSEALGLLPTNADDFAIYLLAFVTTLFRDGKIVYKEEDRDEERN